MIWLVVSLLLLAAFCTWISAPESSNRGGVLAGSNGVYFKLAGVVVLLAICMVAYRHVPQTRHEGSLTAGNYANFILSWVASMMLGIWLFRGSWREALRFPLQIAAALWCIGHILANPEQRGLVFFGLIAVAAAISVFVTARQPAEPASDMRDGHNLLSLIIGTAIYGLFVQMHLVLTGIPALDIGK